MIRGTTAKFKFKLPYVFSDIMYVSIKFWQPNNTNPYLPIIKKLEAEMLSDCFASDDSKELCISLNPEETSRFVDKYKAKVQLRAQHVDGTAFGSPPQNITVYPMSDDMLDPTLPGVNDEGWVILDGEVISAEQVVIYR